MTILELMASGEWDADAKRYNGRMRHTSLNADRDIKICKHCKKVYEVYALGSRRGYTTNYYTDFPTYGKGKCECPECRFTRGKKTFFAWDRGNRSELPWSRFCAGYKKRNVWNYKKT